MSARAERVLGRPPLSLESQEAYRRYRRLLLGALARLARTGFAVQPEDGLDLIHEFFATSWQQVVDHYDPSHARKASFDTYLSAAFLRFARPRISRLRRWQQQLCDPGTIAAVAAASGDGHAVHRVEDASVVRASIDALGAPLRDILRAYLSEPGTSERTLARSFGITRYRLREHLTDAFGTVAVRLNERGAISDADWDAANALWRDGQTVRQAAATLGQPAAEIQTVRRRILALLTEGVARRTTGRPPRSNVDSKGNAMRDIAELIKSSYLQPDNTELLKEIWDRSEEVIERLEEEDLLKDVAVDAPERIEWLAKLYEALAGGVPEPEADLEIERQLHGDEVAEEVEILQSFRDSLLVGLPERLRDLGTWFREAGDVPLPLQKLLWSRESIEKVPAYSEALIPHGLTPLSFFEASEGIAALAFRLRRHRAEAKEAVVLAGDGRSEAEGDPYVVPVDMALRTVADFGDCPDRAAPLLLQWLVEAAHYKPLLFAEHEARPLDRAAVTLYPAKRHAVRQLAERWALGAEVLDEAETRSQSADGASGVI